MKSVAQLRARKVYADGFNVAMGSLIFKVCEEALEYSDLHKKLISTDVQDAVDAGIEIDLHREDAALCYMHMRALPALRDTSGLALIFSKRRRRDRLQLAVILQECMQGIFATYGNQTLRVLELFEERTYALHKERSGRIVTLLLDDDTCVSGDPVEMEERRTLWHADMDDIEAKSDAGEISDDEYAELIRKLGDEP